MKKFFEYTLVEAKAKASVKKKKSSPKAKFVDEYLWLPIIDENEGYGVVDKESFTSGDTNLSKSEMNRLKKLDRDIEYITSISVADKAEDYGNQKDRSGIEWFYVKLLRSEIIKLKLKDKGGEKESDMSEHIQQAHRAKTKYNEWLKQNNYGVVRKGVPLFEFMSKMIDVTTKELLSYLTKIKPSASWKKAQELTSKNKGVFVHVSSNEYQVGDKISAYRTDASIEDMYSDESHLNQMVVSDMESAFEAGRPSNKPSRKNSVYAFRDIKDAISWQKQFNAHYIYVVEPTSSHSIHDMRAVDTYEDVYLGDFFDIDDEDEETIKEKEAKLEQIVKDYWAGKQVHPYRPAYEVLIKDSAKVIFKAKVQ